MQVYAALFLILTAYSGLNMYIGSRILLYFRLDLPPFALILFWAGYFALAFSYVAGMLAGMLSPGSAFGGACRFIGRYWIAVFFYLLLGFALTDILRLSGRLPFLAPLAERLPAFALTAAGALAVGGTLLLIAYGAVHARQIDVAVYQAAAVKTGESGGPRSQGALRVAMISDLHLGSAVDTDWLGRVVSKINEVRPDAVCIAGDIFDNNLGTLRDVEGIVRTLRQIRAPYGVYACPGNHDVEGDAEKGMIRRILTEGNVVLLADEMVLAADTFYIAGRKDASPIGAADRSRLTAAEVTAGGKESLPLILLDHQPGDIRGAADAGADLLLSGHTHRGQIFPFGLLTRLVYKPDYGYRKAGNMNIVVSSGAGVWGPPVRVGTNSEVAVIDFTWYTE